MSSPNANASELWNRIGVDVGLRVNRTSFEGATVFDFGVATSGSIRAGLLMAEACMGAMSKVSLVPCDESQFAVSQGIFVTTDQPLLSCLGCQYAGWPVQTDDYFAMGSGPMRLVRGLESVLEEYSLDEKTPQKVCGLLESDKLPSESAIQSIASDCGVAAESIVLGIAPSTSIAGCIQIVARSAETAMHKLHELEFPVNTVISASGFAPLPPPAKDGDIVGGIGRTNDAMLYGADVTLWVDCDDDSIESILQQVPSSSSTDHGRPFKEIFAGYDFDFYKVDTALFSPAVIRFHNLRSGKTFSAGRFETSILRDSFGT
ncbi:MAG: methenyltetrahydromethanopterin cyclohydrolase [Planctomycetota bacterium]